ALRRAYRAAPMLAREGSPGVVIPDEALTAAGVAFWDAVDTARATTPTGDPRHVYPDEVIAAAVAAAAPLVVAAELRRIVGHPDAAFRARELWAVYLRNRANALDPGGAR